MKTAAGNYLGKAITLSNDIWCVPKVFDEFYLPNKTEQSWLGIKIIEDLKHGLLYLRVD